MVHEATAKLSLCLCIVTPSKVLQGVLSTARFPFIIVVSRGLIIIVNPSCRCCPMSALYRTEHIPQPTPATPAVTAKVPLGEDTTLREFLTQALCNQNHLLGDHHGELQCTRWYCSMYGKCEWVASHLQIYADSRSRTAYSITGTVSTAISPPHYHAPLHALQSLRLPADICISSVETAS